MQIDCEGEWLSSYLDGALSDAEVALAEQHLAACPACRAHLQQLQQVAEWMAQQVPDVPETLAAYVLAALPGQAPGGRVVSTYVSLGVAGGIGLALTGVAAVITVFPRLSYAWGILRKFFTIMWAAGTAQMGSDQVLGTAMAVGASVMMVTLAVFGTRLLSQGGERSV